MDHRPARYNGAVIRKAIIVVFMLGGLGGAFFWATSFYAWDLQTGPEGLDSYVYYWSPQTCFYITSLRGWLRIGTVRLDQPFELPPPDHKEGWAWLGGRVFPDPNTLVPGGPVMGSSHPRGPAVHLQLQIRTIEALAIPHWALCVALLTYPAVAFIRGPVQRYRRRRKGRCLKCGYDLTGNISGVCPECGTEVKEP